MLTEKDIDMLKEDLERVNRNDAFEELKYYSSQQIADVLIKAHNNGLLAISGGLSDDKDVDELYVALMIAIKMLKTNNLYLKHLKII